MVTGPRSAGSAVFLWPGLSFLGVVGAGGVLVSRGCRRVNAVVGRTRVCAQRAVAGFGGAWRASRAAIENSRSRSRSRLGSRRRAGCIAKAIICSQAVRSIASCTTRAPDPVLVESVQG